MEDKMVADKELEPVDGGSAEASSELAGLAADLADKAESLGGCPKQRRIYETVKCLKTNKIRT